MELVNDVLDLSKIEAGKMEVRSGPVNSKEIFEQALLVVRGPADGKNVKLRFAWDENIPKFIETDGVRLRQVLINLLGNAVKFTDSGSVTLEVRVARNTSDENQLLVFEIKDTGLGISPEDLKLLFRPFSQIYADSVPSDQSGTGLGLHLCKELMELLGGSIEAESTLGKGSIFRCILPLVGIEENPYETQKVKTLSGLPSRQLKILVVDDNPINRRVLKLQLDKLGQNTSLAESGEEALASVGESDYDLVLMDCQMPEMDGLEATRRIREKHGPSVKIVALTAFAEDKQRDACLQAGMNDFLTKPVEASRLSALLKKHGDPES
jgi:CheY-like chemotaxis protein